MKNINEKIMAFKIQRYMKTKNTIAYVLFLFASMLLIDVHGESILTETVASNKRSSFSNHSRLEIESNYVQEQKKIMSEKGWTLKVEKNLTVLSTGIWQSNLFNAKSGKRYTAQIVSGSTSLKGAEFAIAPQGYEASSVLKSDGGFPGAITYAGGVESKSGNLVFWWKLLGSAFNTSVTILIWEK